MSFQKLVCWTLDKEKNGQFGARGGLVFLLHHCSLEGDKLTKASSMFHDMAIANIYCGHLKSSQKHSKVTSIRINLHWSFCVHWHRPRAKIEYVGDCLFSSWLDRSVDERGEA